MIRCVIWDLGNTFLRYKTEEYVLPRLCHILGWENPGDIVESLWDKGLIAKWDSGELTGDEFFREVAALAPKNLLMRPGETEAAVARAFTNCFELPNRMRSLAHFLSEKGLIQGVLSNMNAFQRDHVLSTFPTLQDERVFQFRVFSCEELVIKPDPRIYIKAFVRAGEEWSRRNSDMLNLEECVFIDDMQKNLEFPERIGMKVILSDRADYGVIANGLTALGAPVPPKDFRLWYPKPVFKKAAVNHGGAQ